MIPSSYERELAIAQEGRQEMVYRQIGRELCGVPGGDEPPTLGSEDVPSALETDSDQGGQMDIFSL